MCCVAPIKCLSSSCPANAVLPSDLFIHIIDPLLQSISVRPVSGSGIITLHYEHLLGSGSAAMIAIREKNRNDSGNITITLSSPAEVTGELGREYEISLTRAPESGELNQEFRISTVVLIGSECLLQVPYLLLYM